MTNRFTIIIESRRILCSQTVGTSDYVKSNSIIIPFNKPTFHRQYVDNEYNTELGRYLRITLSSEKLFIFENAQSVFGKQTRG